VFTPLVDPPDDLDHADALWICVRGSEVLVLHDEGLPVELEAAAECTVFLGTLAGRPVWAAGLPAALAPPGIRDLRALYSDVDEAMWALAGRAVQLVAWDRDHQFCGRCGGPTSAVPGERARRCGPCRHLVFPRLAPAIITLIHRGDECLLARNVRFPGAMFSTLAGFVEPGETIEEAVRREVQEEVGVVVGNLRYHGSQPWPFPHSLMIGFFAEYESGDIVCQASEIADAQWFRRDALPMIPPPMSIARRLIDAFVDGRMPS
jgi:NAD+ diphosphatase